MKVLRLGFLMLSLISSLAVMAGPVHQLGFADSSCGAWAGSKDDPARWQYLHWMRGFASGYNYASQSNQVTSAAMPNTETLALYVDKYCRDNPLLPFTGAVYRLVDEIKEHPQQAPRKR